MYFTAIIADGLAFRNKILIFYTFEKKPELDKGRNARRIL